MYSFIIANRGRDANLRLCVESLRRSAMACGTLGWEIVVGTDSEFMPVLDGPHCYAYIPRETGPFNKSKLLNAAIKAATGDILTFIDADAIVPPMFMHNMKRLDDPALTKLCYRVRRISTDFSAWLFACNHPSDAISVAFARYDVFSIAAECYGRPDRNKVDREGNIRPASPVFGNSHFSIRRDTLGDLRFDERYCGRGYEDIQFNWQIWKRHFDTYNAEIVTDADHAILNLANPPTVNEDWGVGDYNNHNTRRYKGEFGEWMREMKAKGVKI